MARPPTYTRHLLTYNLISTTSYCLLATYLPLTSYFLTTHFLLTYHSLTTRPPQVACAASTPDSGALQANQWLAAALAPCGGRGGGKPSFAQGSAPDAGALPAAIEAARAFAAGPQT